MSLILSSQDTEPKGLMIKTFGASWPGVHLGDYTISEFDFCEAIMYFLTNTDLESDDRRLKLVERIRKIGVVPGWVQGRERLGTFESVKAREKLDAPDMTRMGDKHIKQCKGEGCDALILWAKHVETQKAAPLVKAKESEKPNIAAWFDEDQEAWLYAIEPNTPQAEYVNHFSNCVAVRQFRHKK